MPAAAAAENTSSRTSGTYSSYTHSNSSSSAQARQDAGEGTGSGHPGTTSGGGSMKKAAIWTAASPIYARSKRRRGMITNVTRLVYAGLGLTVLSELRGFFVGPGGDTDVYGGYGSSGGSSDTTYKRSRPGLGGQYGRQTADIGLESRTAKRATTTAGVMNGNNYYSKKYDKDKDPLADDDWTPDEAPAGIGGAGELGGIGGAGNNINRMMNAASPMVGGGAGGLGGGMTPQAGIGGGTPRLGTPPGAAAGSTSLASTFVGWFNTNTNTNINNQVHMQPNPPPFPLGGNAALASDTTAVLGKTQAVGRDAVKVTTRTTTLGDNVGGGLGGGLGGGGMNAVTAGGKANVWEQHLNNQRTNDADQDEVKSLQEKVAMLEGKLSSLEGGVDKKETDDVGKTNSNEGKDTDNYLRGGGAEDSQAAKDYTAELTPNHGLDCRRFGGPDDDEVLSDLVYWKDIHDDYSVVSPFHPTIKAASQDGGVAGLSRRYLTFEVDVHAGFNRNRMQFETMLAMAWAMGRILVLPPKWSLWPHESGMASYSSFDDYFDLDALTKKYVGVDIVTMEEFLTKEAAAGWLQAVGGGKFVDSRSIAMGRSLQPPSGKLDWNGDGDISHLFDYLEQVALTPAWDFDTCIASFPKNIEGGTVEANLGLNKIMSGIVRRSDGRPKPSPQSFQGKPTPVDAPPVERLREVMGKRELLCVYDEPMQEANLIHFRLDVAKGNDSADDDHGPGHWYSSIFFEDHKHDLFVKRLMRDGLRYNDEIQCGAAKVIKGIRKISVSNAKKTNDKDMAADDGDDEGSYNALHLRRFRHSHQDAVLPPSDIGAAVSKRFGDGGVMYVATDSRGDEADFLDSIDESVKIVSLRNFITDISRVDPKFYGMIDQVVASRSEVFLGTYFSSFTNGINRLRGYHTQKSQQPKSKQNGAIGSYYAAPKGKEGDMRVYKAVSKPFQAREYPLAWRSIDSGVEESATNF